MKTGPSWLLYAAAALTTAVVCMPAHVVGQQIKRASGQNIRVLASSGTVWQGRVQLGVADGSRVYAIADPLEWTWQVGAEGQWLSVVFAHAKLTRPVHLAWGSSGITWGGGQMSVPAAWLAARGAPFNTIRPEGLLQISWRPWRMNGELNASVTWLDAQSALASIRPLGEYVMTLTGNPGKKLEVQLQTNRGPLVLEGQGEWAAGQRFVFNGYASAQAASREALTGLLSQMGRQEGERYRLGVF